MRKHTFYTEIAYIAGLMAIASGASFMTRADLGLSMVVAPAYILHVKVSQYLPFFSFGMAEYCIQALLLIALAVIMRRFRISYLGSFVTAVLYGFMLDGALALTAGLAGMALPFRILWLACGILLTCLGVSLVFHTYLAPEAYELFVKEISARFGRPLSRVKTVYDCSSLLAAVVLSFCFFGFGRFVGMGAGTLVAALVCGTVIGWISKGLERIFEFRDAFGSRRYLEG